jgi:hypothetical protein
MHDQLNFVMPVVFEELKHKSVAAGSGGVLFTNW